MTTISELSEERKALERAINAELASATRRLLELGAASVSFRLDDLPMQVGARLVSRITIEVKI